MKTLEEIVEDAKERGLNLSLEPFNEICVCGVCSTTLFHDDEAYEAYDGKMLCSGCSVFCEVCSNYFTESEMKEEDGCRICETCFKNEYNELVRDGNALQSQVLIDLKINNYNSVRFWYEGKELLYPDKLKLVVYRGENSKEDTHILSENGWVSFEAYGTWLKVKDGVLYASPMLANSVVDKNFIVNEDEITEVTAPEDQDFLDAVNVYFGTSFLFEKFDGR